MAKNIRRMLATFMVVCMFASAMPLQALAAADDTVPATTTVSTDSTTGDVVMTIAIQDDSVKTEKTEEAVAPEVTVDIPLEEGASDSETTPVKEDVVTGDIRESEEDPEFDETTTSTVTPGSVTVETDKVVTSDEINSEETVMDHVRNEVTPDSSNDLVYAGDAAADEFQSGDAVGEDMIPNVTEGYEYTYVGSSNTSKFFPSIVFTEKMTDDQKVKHYGEAAYIGTSSRSYYIGCLPQEVRDRIAYDDNGNYVEDENGFILDVDGNRILKEEITTKGPNGETYYLHRFDSVNHNNFKAEGWYEDGEWEKPLNGSNKYYAVWSHAMQYLLVDRDGNVTTTYSADFCTNTRGGYGYNLENLEDAEHFGDAEAQQLRTIANAGYWGTASGDGSLENMRQMLKDAGFTDEELASLTDGAAQTATQMAIWSCTNKEIGIEFINSFYSNWGLGNVPTGKEDEVKVMFKAYEYLMALTPEETESKTTDTIINSENFLKDMSVTVIEKADGHSNNSDNDKTNDAYVTDVSFALVVEPSEGNKDDLKITLVTADGKEYVGRVAGTKQDGEVDLDRDDQGNYWFRGIVLTEGGQNITLNLEGVQNLKEGVYLYTSEVRGTSTSSKSMVGLVNGGARGVDVSVDISFSLNVEDEVVAKERVWRGKNDSPANPTTPANPADPAENETRTWTANRNNRLANDGIEITEEPVPLAAPVITGDDTGLWVAFFLAVAFGMVAINLFDKKRI